jgi:hypothetical protein
VPARRALRFIAARARRSTGALAAKKISIFSDANLRAANR